MVRFRQLLFAACIIIALTCSQVNADFSRRYLHAVDQLFRGILSSGSWQQEIDHGNVKRQELGSQLFQLYNNFMSKGQLDFSSLKLPSMDCLFDLLKIVNAARSPNPPQWAIRFADALFKPPAGLLDGNLNWLGAFDECLRIHVNEDNFKTVGKYCLVPVFMDNDTSSLKDAVPGSTEGLNLGLCIPQSCKPVDIANLALMVNRIIHSNNFFNSTGMNFYTRPDKMRCHDPDLEYSKYFIAAMVVIGTLLSLNVLSTIYDVILRCCGQSGFEYAPLEPSTPGSRNISPIQMQTPSALTVQDNSGESPNNPVLPSARRTGLEKIPQMTPINETAPSTSNEPGASFPQLTVCTSKRTSGQDMLLSFSFLRNAGKLLCTSNVHTSRSMLNFGAIHGIRLFSLMWVILGHTFILPMATVDNILPVLNYTRRFEFQVVNQALLAVDTFFVLSGFLLGYVALRQMDKFAQAMRSHSPPLSSSARTGRWFGFFGCFYVHRYLRLTPLLAFVLIVYMGVAPYLLDGPLWIQQTDANCVDHWWTNILYVNNFVHSNEECIGWTWYLAVDTQLFVISPIPLLCFFWRPLVGWLCIVVFIAISICTNVYTSFTEGLTAAPLAGYYSLDMNVFEKQLLAFEHNFFADLYILPWCRCAAWSIGLALGCSLSRLPAAFSNAKLQSAVSRKLIAVFGWTLSTIFGLVIVYGLWPVYEDFYTIPQWVSSFYWAGSRIAWGLVICWVLYVCVSGTYGARPVRAFLAHPGFIPLSRMSYCAYLLHPIVLSCFFLSARNPMHFSGPTFAFLFCGTVLITFASSFIITVLVEMPFANLDKYLLPHRSRD